MKQVQHIQALFGLAGLAKPKKTQSQWRSSTFFFKCALSGSVCTCIKSHLTFVLHKMHQQLIF